MIIKDYVFMQLQCFFNIKNMLDIILIWRLTRIKSQNKPIMNKNIKVNREGRNDGYTITKVKYIVVVLGDGVIYVRRNGKTVWCGNSRHGQKGTIGITYKQIYAIYKGWYCTRYNCKSCYSKPASAQLIECVLGKTASQLGVNCDATPFTGADPYEIRF